MAVLRRAHHLLARAQAHAHFAIDAAGVLGRRQQIFLAAAHLEEVEKLPFEPLGRGARTERAEIERGRARKLGRNLAAREVVVEHDLHVRRHAQLEQVEVGLREMTPRQFIVQQRRFQRRPGESILDARHGVTQIQQARRLLALLQQAQQTAPQQRGFGKIRLAFLRPKHENRGVIGQRFERRIELRRRPRLRSPSLVKPDVILAGCGQERRNAKVLDDVLAPRHAHQRDGNSRRGSRELDGALRVVRVRQQFAASACASTRLQQRGAGNHRNSQPRQRPRAPIPGAPRTPPPYPD